MAEDITKPWMTRFRTIATQYHEEEQPPEYVQRLYNGVQDCVKHNGILKWRVHQSKYPTMVDCPLCVNDPRLFSARGHPKHLAMIHADEAHRILYQCPHCPPLLYDNVRDYMRHMKADHTWPDLVRFPKSWAGAPAESAQMEEVDMAEMIRYAWSAVQEDEGAKDDGT